MVEEASSRSIRRKEKVGSTLQFQIPLDAQPPKRETQDPKYFEFVVVQCRLREKRITNVPKHGHCCARNGSLCSSVSQETKRRETKNADLNNRENNSLNAAFVTSGTQSELSKKWRRL